MVLDKQKGIIMVRICKDCGCEDIRFEEGFGYHCNNCSCNDLTVYDKNNPSEYAKSLKEKYKKQFETA